MLLWIYLSVSLFRWPDLFKIKFRKIIHEVLSNETLLTPEFVCISLKCHPSPPTNPTPWGGRVEFDYLPAPLWVREWRQVKCQTNFSKLLAVVRPCNPILLFLTSCNRPTSIIGLFFLILGEVSAAQQIMLL